MEGDLLTVLEVVANAADSDKLDCKFTTDQ